MNNRLINLLSTQAEHYMDSGFNAAAIRKYEQAIQYIPKTFDPKDYEAVYHIYFNLGVCYFCSADYYSAERFFLKAVRQTKLLQAFNKKLTGNACRDLISSYINLTDTYLFLNQKNNALKVYAIAIEMFKAIPLSEKTYAEKQIGDPRMNFSSFHRYHQKQLSKNIYLLSSEFKNHEEFLKKAMQIDPKSAEASLEDLLRNLSLENKPSAKVSSLGIYGQSESKHDGMGLTDAVERKKENTSSSAYFSK